MKLLFVTTHFFPFSGGLENYVYNMGKELAKRGHEVHVMTLNTEDVAPQEERDGMTIIRLGCYNLIKGVYAVPNKRANKRLKEWKPKYDYIITNTRFFWINYVLAKVAKKNRIKHVHIEHGMSYVKHPNPLIQFCAWLYDQFYGRKTIKMANVVIGISEKCAKFAKKLGAKETHTVYNSVDVGYWKE